MERFDSLDALFVHELRDLHSAEQQLVRALPRMAHAATNAELKQAFEAHFRETQEHLNRLNEIFTSLNIPYVDFECQGMAGIIREGDDILRTGGDPNARDAALIAAAQRAEHYEIAAYGTARTYAQHLGYKQAASLLQKNLDEEGNTDKKLTKLAEGGWSNQGINKQVEM